MLGRTHPKFDLMIISQICAHVIHRMNVRIEKHTYASVKIYELQIILNLCTTEWFQLSAL